MKGTFKTISEVLKLFEQSELTAMTIEFDGVRLSMNKDGNVVDWEEVPARTVPAVPVSAAAAAPAPTPAPVPQATGASQLEVTAGGLAVGRASCWTRSST